MQYFNVLPDEILKKIFSYVFEFTNCNLVCKRFNKIINDMMEGLNVDSVCNFVPNKIRKLYSEQTYDNYNLNNIHITLYEKYKDCVNNDDLFQINYMFCKLRLFYDLRVHNNSDTSITFRDSFDGTPIKLWGEHRELNYSFFLDKIVLINKWNNLAKKYIKNKKSVGNFICVTNKIRECIYKKRNLYA